MISRAVTLIVVQRDLLVRADFDGGRAPTLRALQRLQTNNELSLADRVEFAARSGPTIAARTYVLADDVFCQTLELEARALRGLAAGELTNALACEAQMVSGVAAADAAIAWRGRGGAVPTRSFDVQEIARFEVDEIEDRLRRLGSRLVALSHPAGVPRALEAQGASAASGFRRVERWPDVTAVVDATANGAVEVLFLRTTRPPVAIGPGAADVPLVTLVVPGGQPSTGLPNTFDLGDEAVLRDWLSAWVRAFVARAEKLRIAPLQRPLSVTHKVLLAAAITSVFVGACWFERSRQIGEREALAKEAMAARQPTEALARIRSETAVLEDQLLTLRGIGIPGAREARGTWRPEIPAHLLKALAAHRPEGVLLSTISIGWKGGRIAGIAAALDGVEQLVTLLHDVCAPLGFEVRPQSRQLVKTGPLAGLYSFDFTLARVDGSAAAALARSDEDGAP